MSEGSNPLLELFGLRGKVALVTGGGAGIGRGISRLFVAAGARTIVADRDADAAQAVAAQLQAEAPPGAAAAAVVADVAHEQSVREMFDRAETEFGCVDVLVNNAGIYYLRPFTEISVADWEQVFAVNVRGLFLCMREAIRRMQAHRRGGSIINISSVNSSTALIFDNIHYGSSKAAVNGMTRSAALEFASAGIRINALLPGSIVTEGTARMRADSPRRGPIMNPERIPLARRGQPIDVAAAALFLASSASSYVTGQLLAVDGGFQVS
jgi:NAD(P)-dependent dehydrogenase (short-subunit alcohol dehydrogenase family)